MKTFLTWLFIFAFGFILGAGAGFKILEGISTDLVMEAVNSSYDQFQQSYSGSSMQKNFNDTIVSKLEEQKKVLLDATKSNLKDLIMVKINAMFK